LPQATSHYPTFAGIGLDLIAAFPTPHDQPNVGSRRTAERHRRAEFGFIPFSLVDPFLIDALV
jgi:hypothetical protein